MKAVEWWLKITVVLLSVAVWAIFAAEAKSCHVKSPLCAFNQGKPCDFLTVVINSSRLVWAQGTMYWVGSQGKGQFWGLFFLSHWTAFGCVSSKRHGSTGLQTCPQGQPVMVKVRLQNGLTRRGGDGCRGDAAFRQNSLTTCCNLFTVMVLVFKVVVSVWS